MTRPTFEELRDFERDAHGALLTGRSLHKLGCGICIGGIAALAILAIGEVDTDRPMVCAGLGAAECSAAVIEGARR